MVNFYLQYEYWFAVTQLVLAMLGMGATLTPADFKDVAREPKAVSIGTGIQIVLVPAITYVFIQLTGITAGLAVGIALIAAIPGGTISNVFTHMAKGNTPLSISITTITTVCCLVSTPLILGFLIADYMPDDFTMPRAQIALEIGLCLLLPLLLGMLILKLLPSLAARFSTLCVRGSLLTIAMIAAGSLASGRLDIAAFGMNSVVLMALYMATLVSLGAWTPKLLGLKREDITAIEMEVGVRSINLGLMLKASLFPSHPGHSDPVGDTVLFSLLLFGAFLLLVSTPLVGIRRRQSLRNQWGH
jgi:bile acid:Na+ symporter, BASS family